MKSYNMEISKQEVIDGVNQYTKIGSVEVFYPMLSELGWKVEPDSEDKDGFPVYKDEKQQYVFDAVLAAVKANARNKLVAKTATLKPGLSIASTVEELLESGNKGDALAATREFLATFKAWLPSTKKSEKVQAAVYDLAKNKAGLSLQPDDKKAKFLVYLTDFAKTITEEQAARFERAMIALEDAATAGDALDDM